MKELEKNTNIAEQETTEAVAEQAQQTEKPYTFRKLETQDIFPMFKLLNKIGLKDLKDNETLKRTILLFSGEGAKKGKIDVETLGVDMFLEVLCLITETIPKCEAELYALLSNTSNLEADEIKKQAPATTLEMIIDFINKEEFGDFFKVVLKLFK